MILILLMVTYGSDTLKVLANSLVPIQSRMKEQLRKYLTIRGNAVSDSLFITLDGTALSKRQIQSHVSEYGKKAGIKGVRVSYHTLRHTFAKPMHTRFSPSLVHFYCNVNV
jgi:site-specific recombinase XerD